jgi:soluble lytic murein transglycosylase-like protein
MQRRALLSQALASAAGLAVSPAGAVPRPAPLPPGYQAVGRRAGVPPLLLYAIALQESRLRFGPQALPYPWTLCVAGEPRRFDRHAQAVEALRRSVAQGIRNVDCGCMQVNWHWHADKLGSFERALEPYANLRVGATILRELYLGVAGGSWYAAAGQYHTGPIRRPDQALRAQRYAAAVFAHIAAVPAQRPRVAATPAVPGSADA